MKPFLTKRHRAKLLKTSETNRHLALKLLIECWNAETPHFGGSGPHRYDGNEKACAYCDRPIDWKPVNAGFAADEALNEESRTA